MRGSVSTYRRVAVGLLLAAIVLTLYWPVQGFDFVNWDDEGYVTLNRQVRAGLTGEGVIRAFTDPQAGNWHPLTWLSHMLDSELFSLNPAAHHWTNVLIHLANVLLLLGILERMTGRFWRSLLVALLFALHPLNVESVAWVAERKNVLSTFFWFLTLWAYWYYLVSPGVGRLALVVLAFLCGLLSKPMVVTLPFALLLLDFWPLGRLRLAGGIGSGDCEVMRGGVFPAVSFSRLVVEKLPLFALIPLSVIMTIRASQSVGAVATMEDLPLVGRIMGAVVAYVHYLIKAVVPVNLAAFYPHPGVWPVPEVLLYFLALLLITLLVAPQARRRPYLLTGWLWYLGTLVPVIGIVQAGSQAMADRHTYVPLIGIFVMAVWGVGDFLIRSAPLRVVGIAASGAVLIVLTGMTSVQLGTWRDSVTLFTHALRVTDNNYLAHNTLANALAFQGRYDEAICHYREAVRILPTYAAAYVNLGIVQEKQGNLVDAVSSFTIAVRMKPGDGTVRFKRGELLSRIGRIKEAIAEYRTLLKDRPHDPLIHNNLGVALTLQGHIAEAIREYREAVRLDPGHAGAHNNLAMLLAAQGMDEQAIDHFREAVRYRPDYANAHYQLALLLKRSGLLEEAGHHLREAIRLNPAIVDTGRDVSGHHPPVLYGAKGEQAGAGSSLRRPDREISEKKLDQGTY